MTALRSELDFGTHPVVEFYGNSRLGTHAGVFVAVIVGTGTWVFWLGRYLQLLVGEREGWGLQLGVSGQGQSQVQT